MSEKPLPDGRDLSEPIAAVVGKITLWGLLLMVLPLVPFILLHGLGPLFGQLRPLALIALVVLFTVIHEGFHVFGWRYWGDLAWQDFKFGIKWEVLAPYAHAMKPLRADAYRIGTVLPLIMTGIVPYVLALVTANGTMTILSAIMISGAVGDLYVLQTLRGVPPDATVIDHPENVGCIVVDEGTVA